MISSIGYGAERWERPISVVIQPILEENERIRSHYFPYDPFFSWENNELPQHNFSNLRSQNNQKFVKYKLLEIEKYAPLNNNINLFKLRMEFLVN